MNSSHSSFAASGLGRNRIHDGSVNFGTHLKSVALYIGPPPSSFLAHSDEFAELCTASKGSLIDVQQGRWNVYGF